MLAHSSSYPLLTSVSPGAHPQAILGAFEVPRMACMHGRVPDRLSWLCLLVLEVDCVGLNVHSSDDVSDVVQVCYVWHAGYGGSYFSPPWLWLLALNFDHAAMREPGSSYARDEAAWERLYQKTLDIVNKRLIERGMPTIEAVSASMPART